jgi:hypothetical protein
MPATLLETTAMPGATPEKMRTGKLYDEAIAVITGQGFDLRYVHLGGSGSGYCQLGDRRIMAIDVAQPIEEQIEQLVAAIASCRLPGSITLSDELRPLVQQAAFRG